MSSAPKPLKVLFIGDVVGSPGRKIVSQALPDVALYGAIAKAGLPRNFHPVAQAAE